MADAYMTGYHVDEDTAVIVTRPCWICGENSRVTMPMEGWNDFYIRDVHPATAWPESTPEQQALLMTGTHLKCWDQEFPPKNEETA